MSSEKDKGWDEWRQLLYDKIDGIESQVMDLRDDVTDHRIQSQKEYLELKTEIAKLRIRAGIWGTIGASIPAAAIIVAQLMGFGS